MAIESEFAEILQQKLEERPSSPLKSTLKSPISSPFPEWKYQFSTQKRSFVPSQISNIYPKKVTQKTIEKPHFNTNKSLPLNEPVYKIGELGLHLASALNQFQSLGAQLEDNKIGLSILKKEYRRLAKKYHPDKANFNSSEKYFQSLCRSFKELEEALINRSKK